MKDKKIETYKATIKITPQKKSKESNVISLKDKLDKAIYKHQIELDDDLFYFFNSIYEFYTKKNDLKTKPKSFLYDLYDVITYITNSNINQKVINEKFDILIDSFCKYIDILYYFSFSQTSFDDKKLCSYLEYATIGGGKRIRALLVFLVGFLYLPDVNQLMSINSYMLAIEMIHSFSLVHDDLPAIDNDEIRRFKPSVWKKYGEAAAILTGDCLLNQAYSFLLFTLNYVVNMKMHKLEENVFEKKNITKESLFFELDDIRRQILGMYFLADAVGVDGLISGELYDTLFMSKKLSKEKILDIYAKKTGKLFQVSMIIPSCIIYSDERVNMAIGKISEKIGIAYQLLDDLQEHYKSTQEIGKPNDSDIKNDKYTFLRIFGVDETKKELKNIKSFILKQFNIISKRVSIHNERVLLLKYFILYIFDKFGFNEK